MALLTTAPATSPRRVRDGTTDLCALACAASAGVHGALVLPHAEESTRMAVAFGVATMALAVAAVALAVVPRPAIAAGAAALLLGVAIAYALSRSIGLPGLTPHSEPVDTLGTVTSVLEVAAALVAVRHTLRRRQS